ncbi:RNA-binding S4 domain-containing protein [Sphingobacterium wenxiniae]|uniref:Ribosome-associated protein n=1 Tax=Sphingobacterium wenxiniae TaxID=683125 RepID=A0A1I6QDP3_9SPHI|nr:RNA-binding S4 domain-containing protein [Sphingobacterium wenxiniae]SFS50596.1 ribosome-associated protein [Sphingobacterium wenxiniae]
MQTFTLKGDFIQLIQLLKVMNWVEHGAMAQYVVEEGMVKYNGEVDYRKRLKVRVGDRVEFDGQIVEVVG